MDTLGCPDCGDEVSALYRYKCVTCQQRAIEKTMQGETMETAKRDDCGVRFDLIPPTVLIEVSKVLAAGAERYGDNNWKSSRLSGEHGPVNHAMKHIVNYNAGIPDEDGDDLKIHLSHAIVNLMFEYWYEENENA